MAAGNTLYPFRLALKSALRATILSTAVPNINAALTAFLTGNIDAAAGATIPQFGDATVIRGEQAYIDKQCIITIETPLEIVSSIGLDKWLSKFYSSIKLKVPVAGDNAPEDFSLVGDVVTDNLRDALATLASLRITPMSTGDSPAPVLPYSGTFSQCQILRTVGPTLKEPPSEGLKWWQWETTHYAQIDYYLARPLTTS